MKTRIFHSVNSGLYFCRSGTSLLVDGLHRGKDEGCSPMPPELLRQAEERTGIFSHLDFLTFTHLHGDHFDAELVSRLLDSDDPPRLLGSYIEKNTGLYHMDGPEIKLLEAGDIKIFRIPTVHEGEMFAALPHYSLVVQAGDEAFFVAGDGMLDGETAEKAMALSESGGFEAVFINPMQLLSDGGKEFLRAVKDEKIFVYHLPEREDDVFSYGMTAKWTVKANQEEFPEMSIPEHMHWLV